MYQKLPKISRITVIAMRAEGHDNFQALKEASPSYRILSRLACFVVGAAAAVLSLSALFWVKRHGLNPLVSHSDFFACSWLYALRWGAGENIFLPHSQLTVPVFALLDRAFDLTTGTPNKIIEGWATVSFYWPVSMMLTALSVLFLTTDRKHPLIDVVFSSLIFIVSFPLFLEDSSLLSTSYHSLSIPLALVGLIFWKQYIAKAADKKSILFFACLGFYAAFCALGKPTFPAFAIPFYAMETANAYRNRDIMGFAKIAFAISLAVFTYLIAIIFFYHHGLDGLSEHFQLSRQFMTSQYHWYDAAKGATPFHWYLGYVIKIMGPLPSILMLMSLLFAWCSQRRAIIFSGVVFSYASALFVLHARSQIHAHAEFISLAAATTIGAFRCSDLPARLQKWLDAKTPGATFPLTAITAAIAIFIFYYPLELLNNQYLVETSKYDAPIVNALFSQPRDVRTIAVFVYPDIFFGATDSWCRGGSNIFNSLRSDFFDDKFGNLACAMNEQPTNKDYLTYNRVLFRRKSAMSISETVEFLTERFPTIFRRLGTCRPTSTRLPDESSLIECELKSLKAAKN